MAFLLDTDICSAHLRRPSGLMHRFIQHSGGLTVSTVVLGELYAWAYHRSRDRKLLDRIEHDLLVDVAVVDFDRQCAHEFGRIRGYLLARGITVGHADVMNAAIALVHDLTLVTHNTVDYQHVADLRLEDWLTP